MKPPEPQPPKPNECPAWMMTFGDCMSLLVCFFVMLIAFSDVEEDQLGDALGAMKGALNGWDPVVDNETDDSIDHDWLAMKTEGAGEPQFLTVEEMADKLPFVVEELRASDKNIIGSWPDRLIARMLDEGLTIIIRTRTLFRPGSTEWLNGETGLWQGFAQLLEGRGNAIQITSVLSSQTIVESASAKTVWGLGVLRAETVARSMEAAMKASPDRIGLGVQLHTGQPQGDLDSIEITILGKSQIEDINDANRIPNGVL